MYEFPLTLSALKTKTDTFAKSVDPDKTAHEPIIRIYSLCYYDLDLQLSPFWQQWVCPNAEMEGPISETQFWCKNKKYV